MLGIPLGLLTANATEWLVHKHVLHEMGRDKKSFWAFHWHDHHRAVRRGGHYDGDYATSPFKWNGQGKDLLALAAGAAAFAPLLPLAPFFVGTLWYSAGRYYYVHRKSHLDIEWARKHLPWHYDHHMGPNQNANWCVTKPWFDIILGTREPYVGTKRELRDRARSSARAQRAIEQRDDTSTSEGTAAA